MKKFLRLVAVLLVAALLITLGILVGKNMSSSTSSSQEKVRSMLTIREDDNGKLYIGNSSVEVAYNTDRVLRLPPQLYFDKLPTTCDEALKILREIRGKYANLQSLPLDERGLYEQTALVGQSICIYDVYYKFITEEIGGWATLGNALFPDSTGAPSTSTTATKAG